jgi:hypothetical protein
MELTERTHLCGCVRELFFYDSALRCILSSGGVGCRDERQAGGGGVEVDSAAHKRPGYCYRRDRCTVAARPALVQRSAFICGSILEDAMVSPMIDAFGVVSAVSVLHMLNIRIS